jgi:hypothetical protein
VAVNHLSESDVLFSVLNPNRDPIADFCIWDDKNVATVNPCDPITLIADAIDFNGSCFTNVDWWLLIRTLGSTVGEIRCIS